MATHCSILAWRIPWTEEPSRLESMWSQSWTLLSVFMVSYAAGRCHFLKSDSKNEGYHLTRVFYRLGEGWD